jgi:hypothetical protein
MDFKGADGTVTDSSERVINGVYREDPPANLFLIPSDYRELSPMSAEAEVHRYYGVPLCQECQKTRQWRAMEDAYERGMAAH